MTQFAIKTYQGRLSLPEFVIPPHADGKANDAPLPVLALPAVPWLFPERFMSNGTTPLLLVAA